MHRQNEKDKLFCSANFMWRSQCSSKLCASYYMCIWDIDKFAHSSIVSSRPRLCVYVGIYTIGVCNRIIITAIHRNMSCAYSCAIDFTWMPSHTHTQTHTQTIFECSFGGICSDKCWHYYDYYYYYIRIWMYGCTLCAVSIFNIYRLCTQCKSIFKCLQRGLNFSVATVQIVTEWVSEWTKIYIIILLYRCWRWCCRARSRDKFLLIHPR